MHTTTVSPAHRESFVDEDTLICPGCFNHVRAELPTSGRRLDLAAAAEFCHRDGSALCADGRGRASEPVEVTW